MCSRFVVFLGWLVNRRFVEGFSLIVALLTKLLRKNAPFRWIDDQQANFDKLKHELIQTPVFIQPEKKDYVVYSDVSHTKLGCVFMQEGMVVAYASRSGGIIFMPSKAIVVVDAMSRKPNTELRAMFARLSLFGDGSILTKLQVEEGLTYDFGFNANGVLCLKHERVTMDFVSGLPLTSIKKDFVWVIMDRFTKSAHLLPITPYEVLHVRKCQTPFCRFDLDERKILGPDLVQETEARLVAYKLELPPELNHIHDVFHVSMLRKYHLDPSNVVRVEEIEVRPDLSFEESIKIVDREIKGLTTRSSIRVDPSEVVTIPMEASGSDIKGKLIGGQKGSGFAIPTPKFKRRAVSTVWDFPLGCGPTSGESRQIVVVHDTKGADDQDGLVLTVMLSDEDLGPWMTRWRPYFINDVFEL
ncbi:Retrovirus-related Pol polyprotein from transposon 17.6 [Gossypium australe]|uniref:Retrovirus-related Pol polyprotein from transposon 17.6 n=1 Tax=Gossypium australe TaxID=47621 RepID=A0A5B6WTS9_9ROSI|nr:Retrovirus-related Pol polyprotein from transposon 17.6 [Gossypium australe]